MSNIHKVLITALHDFLLPYPQFTQEGHSSAQCLPPQWNMNEHPGWSLLLTLPWANAIGKACFYITSLQPRSSAFSSVLHKVEMLNMRRKEDCTHRYMNQRPVGIRGGEYTHLNQDKLVYFIYCLFIIEYISLLNNSETSPFLPVSWVLVHNTWQVHFHILFSKVSLLTLDLNFLLLSSGRFGFIIQSLIPSRWQRTSTSLGLALVM